MAVGAGGTGAGSYQFLATRSEACQGADLVTTDVWTSMGYEAENEARKKAFADWCVDVEMMVAARPRRPVHAPACPRTGEKESEADVIDGPQSVVWDEAENRMHVQKALMEYLLLGRITPAPAAPEGSYAGSGAGSRSQKKQKALRSTFCGRMNPEPAEPCGPLPGHWQAWALRCSATIQHGSVKASG